MRRAGLSGWEIAGILIATVAIAIRIHNALVYPVDKGYDAAPNWEYVELLLDDWRLPAPDAGWSTAHPPLFFYTAAAVGRLLGHPDRETTIRAVRLLTVVLGLLTAVLAMALVQRRAPESPRRVILAGALVWLLPVHIYMSAMLSEEIWVSAFTSLAVVGVAWDVTDPRAPRSLRRPLLFGAIAGLAFLTKLTGVLAIAAVAGAYLFEGWRRSDVPAGVTRAAAVVAVGGVVGGWFYVHNLVSYGYLYPQDLDLHAVMFTMPPGFRTLRDYLWIPLATWTDPRPLSPELLHSVWGTTYGTIWFDSHRHFFPRHGDAVLNAARLLIALGLLPTAAFLVGLVRGAGRALRGGPDFVLLLLTALTLAGFAAFTWANPWFVTLKGSFLLGLAVPFAWYASEVLADWTRPGRWSAAPVWIGLLALAVATVAVYWHGMLFWKLDDPGLQWVPIAPPGGMPLSE